MKSLIILPIALVTVLWCVTPMFAQHGAAAARRRRWRGTAYEPGRTIGYRKRWWRTKWYPFAWYRGSKQFKSRESQLGT
jgi:hypothetical protein